MERSKRFKYEILANHKLIIESWAGKFSLREILEYKTIESADKDWDAEFNVLADDRNISINLDNFTEHNDQYLAMSQNFIKKRKTAILTCLPNQVVASELLKLSTPSNVPVKVEAFSTLEAALNWLKIDLNETAKINAIIERLKND